MTANHSHFNVSKCLFLGVALLSLTFLGCPTPKPPKPVDDDATIEKPSLTVPETTSYERVVERVLPHRKFSGQFATTGRGEDAKWGINKTLNFQYTVSVIAESKVLSRESTESGYIKVEEIRTFHAVTDNLVISDVDIQLCLDTLPIQTFSNVVKAGAVIYGLLSGDATTAAEVIEKEEYVTSVLKQFDGTSLRGLWGLTGMDVPEELEKKVNELANARVLQAIGGVRKISGKSYKFIWYQKETGEPIRLKYSYLDGSEVTDEDELMVLKRVNTFIDYYLAPDENCKPGDSWDVSAENLQEAFDPYVDGTYVGAIGVLRKENEGEDWKLEMRPSEIRVRSENETTGELKITQGHAILEPKGVTLKELFAEGTANLRKISKHHLLFTAHIEGDCQFQGRLVSEEILDDQNDTDGSNTSLDQ